MLSPSTLNLSNRVYHGYKRLSTLIYRPSVFPWLLASATLTALLNFARGLLYLKQEVWTGAPLGQRISNAAYLLVSQSILSVAIHDLAGWEPAGESLYHALGRDALEKEGIPVLRRNIMEQKRQPYLSVGIDIGADFSPMAIALPIQEIIGKPYKILHSSNRSVQGAVERILSTGRAYELPVRVYMESTGIYHLPLYHRLKDAGLDVYVLNPLVTHANQNINIRNIHNDKLDARRIALLGLRPDLKTSIVPADPPFSPLLAKIFKQSLRTFLNYGGDWLRYDL